MILKPVTENVTAVMAIGGQPGSVDTNYVKIATNILSSIKTRELGPNIGPVSGETRQIAGLALQNTRSRLGTSTRVNYWFCSDSSFKLITRSLNSGGSFSSRSFGTYEVQNGVLQLYFDDGERSSLPMKTYGITVVLNGLSYQKITNDLCL